jgi:LPXTG-motif cell wall-anchored protein
MRNLESNKRKSNNKYKVLAVVATTALGLGLSLSASALQPTITMGTAKNFAVLAGSGITNTGETTVSGTNGAHLGSSPTTTFVGAEFVTSTGTKYTAASAVVDQAKTDLVIAYNDAAGRTPATTVAADLGGQTLTEGVYNSASSLGLTGTLTLDAQNDSAAVFIFQAGSTLTTAGSSSIVLINGALACNVFWQVGSSATLGTDSTFVGSILALTSITAGNEATINGQLLAQNGAVTLDSNTIVNNGCASAAPSPSPSPTTDVTVTGGQLPNTDSTQWVLPLAVGLGLVAIGGYALLRSRKRS